MGISNQPRRRHRPRTFNEKFWENERGEFVVWQKPNLYLSTWAASTFIDLFVSLGVIHDILSYVGLVALILWSVLEVYGGVNYFRRTLGGLVLLAIIVSHLLG